VWRRAAGAPQASMKEISPVMFCLIPLDACPRRFRPKKEFEAKDGTSLRFTLLGHGVSH
jgi:hypothetical protein